MSAVVPRRSHTRAYGQWPLNKLFNGPARVGRFSRVWTVPAASRLTIRSLASDPRGAAIAAAAEQHGLPLAGPVQVADIAFVEGELGDDDRATLAAFLADPLLQSA